MEFKEFNELLQKNITRLLKDNSKLFTVEVDKDKLWDLYLDSFPEGTNKIFRERREFDCSCCKNFIRAFGDIVAINENYEIKSIWEFNTNDNVYQPVIDALNKYVNGKIINNVFITDISKFGTKMDREKLKNNTIKEWSHFYVELPKSYLNRRDLSNESLMSDCRTSKDVFKRSLEEITPDSLETVLDLITQNTLYKGKEWEKQLKKLIDLQKEYNKLSDNKKDNFCWRKSIEVGPAFSRIRNHSIGVLLQNISQNMDLNIAVKKYEAIVAPSNYKRPKEIFTKKMVEEAEKFVVDNGFADSLGRRYAKIDDITVNNILFANRDVMKKISKTPFGNLKDEVKVIPKNFDHVEEVPVEKFIKDILPRTKKLEVLVENRHTPNMVSLIAPISKDAPSLFKWDNAFSWAHAGNLTDSMKNKVEKLGGKIDGVLRFSIQWNDNGDNNNDFDAHCLEPDGTLIYFSNKRDKFTTGKLDVDIQRPRKKIAVENITWDDINKMHEGKYKFMVHNYCHRGGRSGFTAEIEYDGVIHHFTYDKELKNDEKILVAEIVFNRNTGIKFLKALDSTESSKKVWGIDTNKFYPVEVCCYSPNYWDELKGLGHKHYMFMIKDCINEESPNGFFNEFLKEDLLKHKRVFAALGRQMKVEHSDEQLSGLGFSETKRDSLVVKVSGHVDRTIKVMF